MRKVTAGALALLSMSATAHAASWTGKASFYRSPHEMTCAHKTLPFGTKLRVTNLVNNRSTILTVADRGPFIKGRIVDVSMGAANVLGFRRAGVVPVQIETVSAYAENTAAERTVTAEAPEAEAPVRKQKRVHLAYNQPQQRKATETVQPQATGSEFWGSAPQATFDSPF